MSSNLASPTNPPLPSAERPGVIPAQGIAAHVRRPARSPGRAAWRPARSSRRASTCASAPRRSGCAPRSCRARATLTDRLADFEMHRIDLGPGAVLEKGCVYVVPLLESLALPPDVTAVGQRQELDRAARSLHPADHRPRRRVRPHRAGLRRPALRRDLAALVLGAGAAGHAAEPDPLPPRLRRRSTTPSCARSTPRAAGGRRRRTSPAASPSRSTSSRATAGWSATAPSRIPG